MKKILAFAGSNSSRSINHQFIEAAASLFAVEVEIISLRDYEAPLFGVDLKEAEGVPASMTALSERMKTADGYFISIPEHNGSMPAVLKNTFDWLSMLDQKFFHEKPTVFVSTSPGPRGGQTALKHVLDIMPFRGAAIVGSFSLGNFREHVKEGGLGEDIVEILTPIIRTLETTITTKTDERN